MTMRNTKMRVQDLFYTIKCGYRTCLMLKIRVQDMSFTKVSIRVGPLTVLY